MYILEPEVPAGLGPQTIMSSNVHPPKVSLLHLIFEGWRGGHIIEVFPCFAASEFIIDKIRKFSGFEVSDCLVDFSDNFIFDKNKIPKFHWLKINGIEGKDDFSISKDFRLLLSDRAYKAILEFLGDDCNVEVV